MLIQLPVETWIEILDWLRRRDLLKKLDSLWDREFTPIVQDWLHKYTKNVAIGTLKTDKVDGLSVHVCMDRKCWAWKWEPVPFAEVEKPGNITNFKQIQIKYLDSTVLTLLRQMRPLFHKVHLMIYKYDGGWISGNTDGSLVQTQTALRLLMPMISNNGSIESMVFGCQFLQFFSANYPTALLNAKLLGICEYSNQEVSSGLLINWLFTPREDGLPRTLVLESCCDDFAVFWEKLRERFLDPTRQSAANCPFFIRILGYIPNLPPNGSVIENVRSGEHPLIVNFTSMLEETPVLISNCAQIVDRKWTEKAREVRDWEVEQYHRSRIIWLNSLEEIGQLCAEDEDANQQQQQASGSGMKLI